MAGESRQLAVVLNGRVAGRVTQDTNGRLELTYIDEWRLDELAYPLSLSMPLTAAKHRDPVVTAFLWGLLPDNEQTLSRWAQGWHVSPRNPFALLSHVGEDCAGAVQFVAPDMLEDLLTKPPPPVQWLTEAEVAERLRRVREDHGSGRTARDAGQFSLAGAQPKTALLEEDGRWGIPSGRVPTTHILKPPTGDFDGHAENEHFCLRLAEAMGLTSTASSVQRFEGETAIVLRRYDRQRAQGSLQRVHQEDCGQALGHPPTRKYENEGGPGITDIVRLLEENSSRPILDRDRFIDSIIFNWLIGGTDAHAKNYSLLIGRGGRVRLAPLYDLASALPYPDMNLLELNLAMRVGKRYRLVRIGPRQWSQLATQLRLAPAAIGERVLKLAERLPDTALRVRADVDQEGLTHAVLDRLVDAIARRARRCESVMTTARNATTGGP
jgi:serine/threonine-protein kinase HipA